MTRRRAARRMPSPAMYFTEFTCEPSGAVTLAGLPRLVRSGHVDREASVVCVVTGSGFKDFEQFARMVQIPERAVTTYDEMLAAATALDPEGSTS